MSHVATIEIEVKDLDGLAEAARRCAMELVPGQQTYRWYGKHVGDYPLPEGFAKEELGKCDHALRIAGNVDRTKDTSPYEVGVVKRRDGRPGYTLLWDFFAGGFGLRDKIGVGACTLKREYATVVAKKQAIASGFIVTELKQKDGSVQLRCVR